MFVFDAHVHIWRHASRYPWAPGEKNLPAGDALPETLMGLLRQNGVQRAMLVQYIQYRWDNRYVADALKAYPSVFGGICRVNPADPDSPQHLRFWAQEQGFQGVRLGPPPGGLEDWFTPEVMRPLFNCAASLRMPVVLLLTPSRLGDLRRILEAAPDTTILLDHLADCLSLPVEELQPLLALADNPRVFLKLGHVAQHSREAYPWTDTHPQLRVLFEVYSARRILWGSDWPFCLEQMSYAQSLELVLAGLPFLSQDEREWVAGKTALSIWGDGEKERL